MKVCTGCKETKNLSAFSVGRKGKEGLKTTCKKCDAAYNRKWHSNNLDRVRNRKYKYRYNISLEEYNFMFLKQKGKCACCEAHKVKSLVVDHCHKTGKVRGLVCNNCNSMLGYAKDSISNLEGGIKYLVLNS